MTVRELAGVRYDRRVHPGYPVPVDSLLGRKPRSFQVTIPGFEVVSIPPSALRPADCQRAVERYGVDYKTWGLRPVLNAGQTPNESMPELGRVFILSKMELGVMRQYLIGEGVEEPLHQLTSIRVLTGYPFPKGRNGGC